MCQKKVKNGSKMSQKWVKNGSKMGRKLLHFGAFFRRSEAPWLAVLRLTLTNSDTPDPMRASACVASSVFALVGVDSMASDHFFGDRGAFDVATLVALAPSDAPQIEVADGVEHAPTHQGVVPLRVRGHGIYARRDRVIKVFNAKFVPGFPSHQRLLSAGRLEHDGPFGTATSGPT